MNYTVCPSCGFKLVKIGEGSTIEVFCPRCTQKMIIEVNNSKIIIQKLLSDKLQEEA